MSVPQRNVPTVNALPTEGIRVGYQGILIDFLELCGAFRHGSFFFTAPFFDECFLNKLLSQLSVGESAFQVVVRNSAAADEILDYFARHGCKSVSVLIAKDLHAKVYIFESTERTLLGLVGSHNPTAAGMKANLEIGIYLASRIGKPEWKALFELREFLRKRSQPHLKTRTNRAVHRENENDHRSCVN